jgi:aspartyl-tRNA(Asn)/glutamyl-tRNA(Gln) amidotransferase subunit A
MKTISPYLSIGQIQDGLKKGEFTTLDLVNNYLARIKKLDPKLKAFITVTEKEALKKAREIDQKIAKNQKLGSLFGTVMAVKDIYLTKGVQTTSASQVLKGYLPQYSATVYQRLLDQDAILIGKTNTDTFALGASTENSGFFTTHNPWDTSLVPGGSSGGSAAAQSSGFCTFSLGTDTGGSIRQPSSLCSVTGLKPTYGRNSRYGITALASSFDCPGAFAHSVEDLSLVTSFMAGQDPSDATTSSFPVPDYPSLLKNQNLKGLKIGLPKEYFTGSIDKQVKEKVLEAAKVFEKNGAKLIDVSLPGTDLGIAVYYILMPCELSSNMARYDGLRFGQTKKDQKDLLSYYLETRGEFMEAELKRRIIIGTYFLSAGYFDAYYLKASSVRTLIKQEFQDIFKKVDLLLTPTSPTSAWKIGEKVTDPLKMYLADVYTVCVNVAGLPALALPAGFSSQHLPIGFQLIGNYFAETQLFSVGHRFQTLTDHHLKHPPL